ncbi:MAG: acyloxyacyl hydrolase [Alphaproteobacteria bacterium]|nr:acyloxyacyl hydrolase [Alphaproteobacteria bacterium]QQS56277.1 MAG: acyloxyacyl hydrolase [Alphaproteobacteria bacterium]
MKKFSFLAFVLSLLVSPPAFAEGTGGFLGLSIGYYDIFPEDDGQTVDFRAEYRPDTAIFIKEIKPWAGLDLTADGAFWAGGGFLVDVKLTDHLYLTPSFGAGLYSPGNNNADLFYPLIFRSQFEMGYQFDSGSRLALSFSHMSNCGRGDDNPGVEMLNLYYHIPLSRFSDWKVSDT